MFRYILRIGKDLLKKKESNFWKKNKTPIGL